MTNSLSNAEKLLPESVRPTAENEYKIPHKRRPPFFLRMRFQLGGALILSVLLPTIIILQFNKNIQTQQNILNSITILFVQIIVLFFIMRRIEIIYRIESIMQKFYIILATQSISAVSILMFRLEYSRALLVLGFVASSIWFVGLHMGMRRWVKPRILVISGGTADSLLELSGFDWKILRALPSSKFRVDGVAADLRHSFTSEWQHFLAECALAGLPVYHSKQLRESITGKVDLEHLSDNPIGTLLPNLTYLKFKRLADWIMALAVSPFVVLICLVLAPFIRISTGGSALFRQRRIGFGAQPFDIYKLRTMRATNEKTTAAKNCDPIVSAMTKDNDQRITSLGRTLRRWRIDEIPQVFNILRGEMSWIGPRPEAETLSNWYEQQIPFYRYRHIVHPGITGWAQVNQGHVIHKNEVNEKLKYDFYYIKNISIWIDVIIIMKTIGAILNGFGSR